MRIVRDYVGEAINFSFDFKYQRVIEEAIARIENPFDDEDIYQALDDAIIYYDAQWTIMMHHQSPEDANLYQAFEDTIEDLYHYISLVKSNPRNIIYA